MILALRMTPPWSIQPIMFVVNSLLSEGCSGELTGKGTSCSSVGTGTGAW